MWSGRVKGGIVPAFSWWPITPAAAGVKTSHGPKLSSALPGGQAASLVAWCFHAVASL
jgi:hypothetical protein